MSVLEPVRVRIRNFQSVEDVNLEVQGFTCITGKTNIGKSAIMRAISSSILNDPVTGKVRRGANFCTVELSSKDWGFKWEKGERGVNRYTIGGKVFDKIGQKQLDEVVSMGFGSIKVGDDEIPPWWASQFSPLFLLNKSGPQVTDFLSEVSRLTILQDAIVLSARGKRKAIDDAKAHAEESARLRGRLAKVSDLEPLERLHAEMDAQADSIREYEAKVASAESLDRRLKESAAKIRALSGASDVRVPDDPVGDAPAIIATMHALWVSLEACAKKIIALRDVAKASVPALPAEEYARYASVSKFSRIAGLRRSVASMDGISAVSVPADAGIGADVARTTSGQRIASRIAALTASVRALSGVVPVPEAPDVSQEVAGTAALTRAAILAKEVAALEVDAAGLAAELSEVSLEISTIPTCPTCERPIGRHEHPS